MARNPEVPTYNAYLWPIVERLRIHGGSMTIEEMVDDVATAMHLSEEQRNTEHGETGRSEVDYRMAWARTYLKKGGVLENSERGVWRLTPRGAAVSKPEVLDIPKQVHQAGHAARKAGKNNSSVADFARHEAAELAQALDESLTWIEELLAKLKNLPPAAFERLSQRMLREKGFSKVEVTGRSGDGGIDGTGVLRMNLLSFQVLFQCKRYSGSVGPSVVRDFRGAMVGRADKGLIITTGTFTAEARREAVRDGAPAIDLIDGVGLCEILKDLRIGVEVRTVEEVTIRDVELAEL
ncbi:restriction endonuclease [Phenylobacterium kunshanense]|uniref:Restriction endonuclease n=1 Tax=Phenylobacterium kunshanense TaxID=1445034 RepID=A0A328BN66_9CAUL|nr:restriction endonuclease [Phenylobacterium kunshanense]